MLRTPLAWRICLRGPHHTFTHPHTSSARQGSGMHPAPPPNTMRPHHRCNGHSLAGACRTPPARHLPTSFLPLAPQRSPTHPAQEGACGTPPARHLPPTFPPSTPFAPAADVTQLAPHLPTTFLQRARMPLAPQLPATFLLTLRPRCCTALAAAPSLLNPFPGFRIQMALQGHRVSRPGRQRTLTQRHVMTQQRWLGLAGTSTGIA